MSLSVAEERIRRLMARLAADEHRTRVVGDQILRTRQDLANFRQVGAGNNARVSGVVEGCAAVGFPGAVVKVYRQGTSSLLGVFPADGDGLYGGLLSLATDPQDVDIVVEPAGLYADRFDDILTPVSLAFGANPLSPLVIPPTADWCCGEVDYFPGDCAPVICETGRICVTVVVSGCAINLTGATVTITDDAEPPNVIGAGAASGSPAKFCVDIPESGTYHVAASIPGATDQTSTVNATCGIDNNTTLTFPANSIGTLTLEAVNCDGALPGATLTIGGITTPGTDATGHTTIPLGVGTYPAHYTDPYGADYDFTTGVAACQNTAVRIDTVQRERLTFVINPPCCTCHITVTDSATGLVLYETDVTTVFNPGLGVCVGDTGDVALSRSVVRDYQLVVRTFAFTNKTFTSSPGNITCSGGTGGFDPDPGKTLC